MLWGKPDSLPTLTVLLAARAWQELMRNAGFRLIHARPPWRKVIFSDIWNLSFSSFVLIIIILVQLVELSPWDFVIKPTDDIRRRKFGLLGLSHLRTEGRLVLTTQAGMQKDEVSVSEITSRSNNTSLFSQSLQLNRQCSNALTCQNTAWQQTPPTCKKCIKKGSRRFKLLDTKSSSACPANILYTIRYSQILRISAYTLISHVRHTDSHAISPVSQRTLLGRPANLLYRAEAGNTLIPAFSSFFIFLCSASSIWGSAPPATAQVTIFWELR